MSEELLEKLMVYRALDSDYRLLIISTLYNEPEISFNDLARRTGIEKGLLAYHLGVLRKAGLIECEFVRRSKKTSKYRLTEKGLKAVEEFKLDKVSIEKARESKLPR